MHVCVQKTVYNVSVDMSNPILFRLWTTSKNATDITRAFGDPSEETVKRRYLADLVLLHVAVPAVDDLRATETLLKVTSPTRLARPEPTTRCLLEAMNLQQSKDGMH